VPVYLPETDSRLRVSLRWIAPISTFKVDSKAAFPSHPTHAQPGARAKNKTEKVNTQVCCGESI